MNSLITPDEVPRWIPGRLTLDSTPLGWEEAILKGYRYDSLDVQIPTMRDYMIVVYRNGLAEMSRRSGGSWRSARVEPGVVSILTRAEQSQWRWDKAIDVSHIYLSQTAVTRVAGDVFDKDIKDVEMEDIIRSEDAVLSMLITHFEKELKCGVFGGKIYVDALKTQLCIHVLRQYAKIIFRDYNSYGRLSPAQRRLVVQYIEENLDQNISLQDLAGLVQLSVFAFTRKFRADFQSAPHAYVMTQRLKRAQQQLARKDVPLKVVAANCGFSDQSHMNRVFRRLLNVTPVEFRQSVSRC
jgi:AraC family transcriptional regulator